MSIILDAAGHNVDVPVNVHMYEQAQAGGQSLPQYLNSHFPTDATKYGNTFSQICAAEGIVLSSDRVNGLRSSKLADLIKPPGMQGAITTKDAAPASRILFPAVFLQAIEDRLLANQTMTANALESMIAIDESISGERYEQPLLNFDNPSRARSQGIAQLAKPPTILSITAKDRPGNIPTFALGMEFSDQAIIAFTLDLVSLAIARQALVERNLRSQEQMLALLNGDVDNGTVSLAALGKVTSSASLDSGSTGGVLTQKAWSAFLMKNSQLRTLTHIITDIGGALAVENRTGRPTVLTDDPKSRRINTTFDVINPLWPESIKLFITIDPAWPAGTLMGFDKNFAIRRITNVLASYEAIEAFVLERKKAMRFDFGNKLDRLFDDAFDVLTLS